MEKMSEDIYLEKGLAALKQRNVTGFRKGIDYALEKYKDKLNYKGTAENFEKVGMEIGNAVSEGAAGAVKYVNNNRYIGQAVGFVDSYLAENQDKVKEIISSVESEIGMPISMIGLDKDIYKKVKTAIKKKGIIGKEAGLGVLADRLMSNLGNIAHAIRHECGDEFIAGTTTYNDVSKFMAKEFKITGEALQQAYAMQGYKGAGTYALDSIVLNGVDMLEGAMGSNPMIMLTIGFNSDEIKQVYRENGIVKKNGLVDYAVCKALSFPGSATLLYNNMISLAFKARRASMKKELKQKVGPLYSETELTKMIDNELYPKLRQVMELGVPEVLNSEILKSTCEENGIFGEEGVLSYLKDNTREILSNAQQFDIVTEAEIKAVESVVGSAKLVKNNFTFNKKSKRSLYAIDLAKKAEELGIDALELLKNPKYEEEKNNIRKGAYGFNLSLKDPGFDSIAGKFGEMYEDLNSGKVKSQDIADIFKKAKLGDTFFEKAANRFAGRFMKKTIAKRVSDYVLLSKGLVEYCDKLQKEKEAAKSS